MNKTDLFLSRLEQLQDKQIPSHVIHRAKCALLDYIGVTLAGAKEQKSKLDSLVANSGAKNGNIKPIGLDATMGLNDAAFLNGLNAHALDFDDGTNAGIIHLGSPLFSVLIPLAKEYGFDGETLLRAAVLGYEASFSMAMTIQPQHKQRGFHATGTCGLLGIAIAASYALNYTPEQRRNAFSTAAVSATGTLKVLEDGSDLKPYNVGKTALLGLISVQMARAGFVGADDALSGISGFLQQMSGSENVELVAPLLGGTYAIEKAYIKPYAACRYTHPSIDNALKLRKSTCIDPATIESVHIKTYSLAVKKHDHTDIRGAASAKMSIPYSFAVAYLLGKAGMDAFTDECLNNEAVLALTKKITVEEDDEMTACFPEKTVATVVMTTANGQFCERSESPKGEPENPLSTEEAVAKFISLATYGGKTDAQARQIVETVFDVENQLPKLLELL